MAGGSAFPLSEEHATWRAVAPTDGWHVDVAALRAGTIEDDLRARDFTINAIAIPLGGGEPIDPTGGISRLPRPACSAPRPRERFGDDPIRLLRAAEARGRARALHRPGTAELARASAATQAAEPAGERQFAELRGIVAGPRPAARASS